MAMTIVATHAIRPERLFMPRVSMRQRSAVSTHSLPELDSHKMLYKSP